MVFQTPNTQLKMTPQEQHDILAKLKPSDIAKWVFEGGPLLYGGAGLLGGAATLYCKANPKAAFCGGK